MTVMNRARMVPVAPVVMAKDLVRVMCLLIGAAEGCASDAHIYRRDSAPFARTMHFSLDFKDTF